MSEPGIPTEAVPLSTWQWLFLKARRDPRRFSLSCLALGSFLGGLHHLIGEIQIGWTPVHALDGWFWKDMFPWLILPLLIHAWGRWVGRTSIRAAANALLWTALLPIMDSAAILLYHNLRYRGIHPSIHYWETWEQWQLGIPLLSLVSGLFFLWRRRGRREIEPRKTASRTGFPRWRSTAIILLLVWCTLLAGTFFAIPYLPVHPWSIWIAGDLLLDAQEARELRALVEEHRVRNRRLDDVLQHVQLASRLSRRFQEPLPESIYRQYLLSPVLDPLPVTEWRWRRMLLQEVGEGLEIETDPWRLASQVVTRLRQRLSLREQAPSVGPRTIWELGVTDERGFERIYAASLRALGVPARINRSGRAEFWHGGRWHAAARPPVVRF